MQFLVMILMSLGLISCATTGESMKTVPKLELDRFMGDWYVLAGRFTFLEKGVHNGIESYRLNPDEDHIAVSFTYNKDSFEGDKKSIPQKAWVFNKESKAHWKIRPFWPLALDYLVVAVADDYSWTAIGVPDQKYLWIMARDWKNPDVTIQKAVVELKKFGYDSTILTTVPHQH